MPITVESLKKYRRNIFIETGTGRGDGIVCAFTAGFSKCYSIELNEKFYKIAHDKMKNYIKENKLVLFYGNSPEKLSTILKNINEPVTFWLDAHSYTEAPLYEELKIIKNHHIKNHIILIDDVRCIKKDFINVDIEGVLSAVKEINQNYVITYEDGFVNNDILVAKLI